MKLPGLFFAAICLLAQPARAFTMHELVGTWKGTQSEMVGGKIEVEAVTMTFGIFKKTGLLQRIVIHTSRGVERTVTHYLPEASHGRLVSTTKLDGRTIRDAGGNWYFKNRLLFAGFNASDRVGTADTRLSTDGSVLTLDESFSDGTKFAGRLKRQ